MNIYDNYIDVPEMSIPGPFKNLFLHRKFPHSALLKISTMLLSVNQSCLWSIGKGTDSTRANDILLLLSLVL